MPTMFDTPDDLKTDIPYQTALDAQQQRALEPVYWYRDSTGAIWECLDGAETPVILAHVWEICETCQGAGAHCQHLGAITSEQWERDWDDEEREQYMRGAYDRACERCGGKGKVSVIDTNRLNEQQRALFDAMKREEAEYHAAVAAEQRMGA